MTPNSLISAYLTLLVNIITAEIILSPPKFQAVNTTDVAQLMTAGCPKLSHLPVLDLEYLGGGWVVPYMSSNWIHHVSRSLQFHERNYLLEDYCFQVKIRSMPAGKLAKTKAPVWVQTRCPRALTQVNVGCKPVGREGTPNSLWFCRDMDSDLDEMNSYVAVVNTDNRKWIILVKCYNGKGMSWALLTKEEGELRESFVNGAFKQIGQLGLPVKDHIRMPTQGCFMHPIFRDLYR